VSKQDESRLRRIRERSRILVAVGTCAVWGGVAAPSGAAALNASVKVDLNITGCPIEKDQLLASVANLLNGNPPLLPEYPVCTECRMRENNCLLIEKGEVCCGPLTIGGCNARCPQLGVACVGCRGPAHDANFPSALAMFGEHGIPPDDIARKLRTFAPAGVRL
jgi:sulfhydrogenase subunit delta